MPLKKKNKTKFAEDFLSSSSSSERESDSEEELELENEEVQVSFSGYNVDQSDFNGVFLFLKQLFINEVIDLKKLAKVIIKQTAIGSVVKESASDDEFEAEQEFPEEAEDYVPESDDTVYSLVTVVNLSMESKSRCIEQLLDFIINLAKENANADVLESVNALLNDSSNTIGLIINERFINIPQSVSEPSFVKLISEIKRAKKKNPAYHFNYYIMICKFLKAAESGTKLKSHLDNKNSNTIIWCNPEEELFVKEAMIEFDYSVKGINDEGVCDIWAEKSNTVKYRRKLIIIPANNFENVVNTFVKP